LQPAGELTALPRPSSRIKGKGEEGNGEEGRGKEERGKEGKGSGMDGKEDTVLFLSDFLATPMCRSVRKMPSLAR